MPRARDPNREKAYELFKESNGGAKLKEIADKLNLAEGTVRGWKNKDSWAAKLNGTFQTKIRNAPNKKGAQKGNKNAVGNEGGAPIGNQNALKHGLFARYMPEKTLEIMNAVANQKPEDIIWFQIEIQFAAIIRAQQIMYVTDKDDTTEAVKSSGESSTSYEIQFAWDKQASFMSAQSKAMSELRSLIKQFNDMAHETDERRLRLDAMQANINKTNLEIAKLESEGEEVEVEDDGFVEAMDNAARAVWGVSHEEKG